MKKLISISLLMAAILFLSSVSGRGQQTSTIAQLRSQIKQFEAVARDTGTPKQLKSINESFLLTRRVQLRTLLQYQVESLRKYQANYRSHFSLTEKQVVANSIKALTVEIANLPGHSSAISIPSQRNLTLQKNLAVKNALAVPSLVTPALIPQTQRAKIWSSPKRFTNNPAPANEYAPITYANLDFPNATITNSVEAARIIKEAISLGRLKDSDNRVPELSDGQFPDDFYCVIHVVRWAAPAKTEDARLNTEALTQAVTAQNWFLFNNGKGKGFGKSRTWSNEDFTTLNRIYGVKKIWLLYIHLNRWTNVPYQQARYDFSIEKKTAANVNNLFSLAQLFITFPTGGIALADVAAPPAPENLWGGGAVDVQYVPSDITITASLVQDPTSATTPVIAVDKPKKFDNEGRYWWDVSVAVPVKHISQTQFDTTANTVTAKEVDKQNAFALINLYPVPVDIKGSTFTWIPHFVGGVAIAKQPLKKFLLGAGFGPRFANFYVGAVFTEEKRPATLKEGDSATPDQLNADLKKHFKPKFSFGFNLPVRGIVESLKKESR